MKIKKLISSGLIICLLAGNLSSFSRAYEDIQNRYQTLEGEYITIDDSTAGELHEIEIFGNTLQDPDNLENIQSVGDLYVDEEGNPILDKQGREQYKIDILSNNSNLFNIDDVNISDTRGQFVSRLVNGDSGYRVEFNGIRDGTSKLDFKFINGYSYTVSVDIRRSVDNEHPYARVLNIVPEGDYSYAGLKYIVLPSNSSEWARYSLTFSIPNDGKKYSMWLNGNNYYTGVTGFIEFKNIQVEQGVTQTLYTPYQEPNKTAILLPTQLQKAGIVADRLYWDSGKGRYVVEKNIDVIDTDNLSVVGFVPSSENRAFIENIWDEFDMLLPSGKFRISQLYSNLPNSPFIRVEDFGFPRLYLYFDKLKLIDLGYSHTREGVSQAVGDYSLKCYYQKYNIQLIETNITEKIKVPIYVNKTHIFTQAENGVNPTLKVAVDRINKLAEDAVVAVENEPTIDNLATARNIVNQMDESLMKDQLQTRLNSIADFNDLILEKKITTANLDIYIKSQNMISLSLNSNSISFEDFNGTEDMEQNGAIEITVNSSLPYEINAYLEEEIQNADKSKTMDKSILNLKESNDIDYKDFVDIKTKLNLVPHSDAGNNKLHSFDFKLKGGIAHRKDVYKATIKFEVSQK